MTTNTVLLESAFHRFVELIEPLEDVFSVAAFEPRRPDVFTYIRGMDDDVIKQIFRAEDVVNDEYPEILIDFHIVFLDGRPIEDFTKPFPELMYVRQGLKQEKQPRGKSR